ncbi:MAG: transposase [Daejeonella sp.]
MDLINTYFYTATILQWIPLLQTDRMKNIIIQSLELLILKNKIRVYGFVIMPNHMHLVWRNLEMNGQEFPDESLLKFTAHQFKKELSPNKYILNRFLVNKADRKYQFWQRNSLPIEIFSKEMLEQKLNYTHLNPLQAHWNLVEDPNLYGYSSCSFYEQDDMRFPWLVDYREDFT